MTYSIRARSQSSGLTGNVCVGVVCPCFVVWGVFWWGDVKAIVCASFVASRRSAVAADCASRQTEVGVVAAEMASGSVVLASAGGNRVGVIAGLVATSEDRVREMIRRFNELGMASLGPRWAAGRPRRIATDDEAFIVETARRRPEALGQPFTRWSLRKLVVFCGANESRVVVIGRERLREILNANRVTFQRTRRLVLNGDFARYASL